MPAFLAVTDLQESLLWSQVDHWGSHGMAVHPFAQEPLSHQVKLPIASVVLLLFASSALVQADAINFLPDDSLVACRAILPQCFTRADWADLCRTDASVMEAHPEACRLALEAENP